ncbi:MAG: LysE/ArgO family amino acid transporter [Demequina sp.]|jgi:L-lysine exporter family protein LysE/ArgO|nr:LysE/ArgO family amino acid transporter [Demequina sp.]
MTSYLAGLGLMLSLIVAIGAQNLFVLRQGVRREFVWLVVGICAVSDAVLVCAGVAGVGAVVTSHPAVLTVVRWAGAAFLLVYGLLAAKRAWRPAVLDADSDAPVAAASAASVAAACLAITWLNPHVYLDTVFLVGTVASTHALPWVFAAGAITASVVWFTGLGFGARALAPVLATQRAWRVLDALIAVVMIALAVGLVLSA